MTVKELIDELLKISPGRDGKVGMQFAKQKDNPTSIRGSHQRPYRQLKVVALFGWRGRSGLPVIRLPEGDLRPRRSEVAAWLEQFQKKREAK